MASWIRLRVRTTKTISTMKTAVDKRLARRARRVVNALKPHETIPRQGVTSEKSKVRKAIPHE